MYIIPQKEGKINGRATKETRRIHERIEHDC